MTVLLSYLVRKVYKQDDHFVNIDNNCIANDITDLCCYNTTLYSVLM